ncbi:uracil-DNA glycosylase family protein [Ottowia flava]|uniref:Uracil-DNA glycosylase family protein n=1 Tax=Ottowia flava TaxID=2675430 RepID=A0ABW4KSJ2_9BURK|nr:uracil-DNA glycosylase [Ottowia sp. GY511]
MSLQLDARQRAMLAEMGVKLWARPGVPASANAIESEAARADQRSAGSTKDAEPASSTAAPSARAGGPGAASAPPPTHVPVTQTADVAAPAPIVAERPRPHRAPAPAPAQNAARETPIALVPPPPGVDQLDWPTLQATVAACHACALCGTRTQTVFGVGATRARWMVVGEAPGEQEDRRGEPFVGQAGQLLDQMLAALGLTRTSEDGAIESEADRAGSSRATAQKHLKNDVYIANVLKCRPPGNRNPQPDEIAQCEPYLRRQVALVQPHVILAMGRFAVQSLLQTTEPIGRLRGRVHHYQGVPVIVTYHPAYLLRALPEKAKAWQDLCLALEVMGASGEAGAA